MSDVFGSESAGPQRTPSSSDDEEDEETEDPERTGPGGQILENRFVTWDNHTGEMQIQIPQEHAEHRKELMQDLRQEFSYGVPGPDMIDDVRTFIREWLEERGLE